MTPFRLVWGAWEHTDSDVTVRHAIVVGQLVGSRDWAACDPWSSPLVLASWVAVLEAEHSGRDLTLVLNEVYDAPLERLVDAIDKRAAP